jgi:hypothetical protein
VNFLFIISCQESILKIKFSQFRHNEILFTVKETFIHREDLELIQVSKNGNNTKDYIQQQ